MQKHRLVGNSVEWALCAFLFAAASLSAEEIPFARTKLLVSTIDLGEIVPSVAGLDQSPQAALSARVTANTFWQLAVVRDADSRSVDSLAEEIVVSVDGAWLPLTAGMPVLIASGQPTPAEGFLVTTQLRVPATFDMHPGRRQYTLSILVNGQRVDATVRLLYQVPPTITLDNVNGHFAITADRPSEVREYSFAPRTYLVRSNAVWVFDVAPRSNAGSAQISVPYTVEALDADGTYIPLTEAVTAASGPPTGQDGRPVVVQLRLRLAEVAVAGTYESNLEVRARVRENEK